VIEPPSPELIDTRYWNEPLPNEPPHWFQRFSIYLLGGQKVLTAYKEYMATIRGRNSDDKTCAPGSWRVASKKYQWSARAAAYNQYRHLVEKRNQENAARDRQAQWLQRADDAREQWWQNYNMLNQAAIDLLNHAQQHPDSYDIKFSEILRAFYLAQKMGQASLGDSDYRVLEAIQILADNGLLASETLLKAKQVMDESIDGMRDVLKPGNK
jgi:hypothetical protein